MVTEFKSESSSSLGGSSGYLADISNTTSYAVSEFSIFDDGYDADRSRSHDCDSRNMDFDSYSESSEGDDVDGSSESSSREMDNVGFNDDLTRDKMILATDSFQFTPESVMECQSSVRSRVKCKERSIPTAGAVTLHCFGKRNDWNLCFQSSNGNHVGKEGDDVNGSSESSSREMDNVGFNDDLTCDKLIVLATDSFQFTPESVMGFQSSVRSLDGVNGTIEGIQYCGTHRTDEGYIHISSV